MTDFPDPIVLFTNQDWKDTAELFEEGASELWPIPALTPIRMQIREKACSVYIDLELSTSNGRLLITEEGRLAFDLPASVISSRLGPKDCEDRQFAADIVAHIEGRDLIVARRDIIVKEGVTR